MMSLMLCNESILEVETDMYTSKDPEKLIQRYVWKIFLWKIMQSQKILSYLLELSEGPFDLNNITSNT